MKKLMVAIIITLLFGCDQTEKFYVTNIKIVDVESGKIVEGSYIEIENGLITNISRMEQLPEDAGIRIDGNSMYVTPGLSDMHVLVSKKVTDLDYWKIHPGDRFIASGITTIRDTGYPGTPGSLIEHESDLRGNLTIGPNIIRTSVADYSSGRNIEKSDKKRQLEDPDFITMRLYIPEKEMDNILTFADDNEIYTFGNVYGFQDFKRICSPDLMKWQRFPISVTF